MCERSDGTPPTVTEIADAALPYIWDCSYSGVVLRDVCRRLGGRYAEQVARFDAEREREDQKRRVREEERRIEQRREAAEKRLIETLRPLVYERDGNRCVKCGTGERLSIDHIIPRSKQGPSTMENLQTLCMPCNSSKGARVAV